MRRFFPEPSLLASPLFLFPLLWILAACLSQYQLLGLQTPWSRLMVLVVGFTALAFFCGGAIGSAVASHLPTRWQHRVPQLTDSKVKLVLVAFLLLGWAELIHQFIRIGGIPLLDAEGNIIRFDQGGPTIILTNFLTVAALLALTRPRSLLSRGGLFFLTVGAVAVAGFALQGGRGMIVLLIAGSVFSRWLFWGRPRWPYLFLAGSLIFLVVSVGFFFRASERPFLPFEMELFGDIVPRVPEILLPMVPFFLAITTNFIALQGLVSFFPAEAPFGGGIYNAVGFDLFVPEAARVTDISASLTAPWVTSTVAGPLWADGGFVWLVIGLGLIGSLVVGVFVLARRTISLGWCLASGYLLYLTVFSVYTNLWTQQVDWIMIVPLLVIFGMLMDPTAARYITPREADRPVTMVKTNSLSHTVGQSFIPWLLGGVAGLSLLLFSGWLIQRTLPQPIQEVGPTELPQSVDSPRQLMSSPDPNLLNSPVYWLARNGGLSSTLMSLVPLSRQKAAVVGRFRVSELPWSRFDVGSWRNSANPALFEFAEKAEGLDLKVYAGDSTLDRPQSFSIGIDYPGHLRPVLRDYSVAFWSGPEIDLFIVTCFSSFEPCQVAIFSGETGFRQNLGLFKLPFFDLKRPDWSFDFGESRPANLAVIHHARDLERARVSVLLGTDEYGSSQYRRELAMPGDLPRGSRFLFGSRDGVPALYSAIPSGRGSTELGLFPIPLPPDTP